MRPLFFSLDGVDGVGKTTQLDLFCAWLTERGHDVVRCRDPGGTKLGEKLRQCLLEQSDLPIASRSEALLYMAARAQLVGEVIRPALDAGQTVVSDRFLLANVVYQGHAGQLDVDALWEIGAFATDGLVPDLTVVLDMDSKAAMARVARALDRMEARGREYLDRVRRGFLAEAERSPDRIVVVDANQAIVEVQQEIRATVQRLLTEE